MSLSYPTNDQVYVGYSHSIADMNDDFVADLIVAVKRGDALWFQVLEIQPASSEYKLYQEYTVPDRAFVYGQSLFADFGSFLSIISS